MEGVVVTARRAGAISWFTMTVPESPDNFGFPVKFDVETEEITIVPLPGNGDAQFLGPTPAGRRAPRSPCGPRSGPRRRSRCGQSPTRPQLSAAAWMAVLDGNGSGTRHSGVAFRG